MPATRFANPLATGLPLAEYRRIFKTLEPLTRDQFEGRYEGLILGPAKFQDVFRKLLEWGGLAGWAGKEFHGGDGVNICIRGGQEKRVARMRVKGTVKSVVDEQITLALTYYRKPLAYITDEIRAYDGNTVLGMTYFNVGPLKYLPMPFALRRTSY